VLAIGAPLFAALSNHSDDLLAWAVGLPLQTLCWFWLGGRWRFGSFGFVEGSVLLLLVVLATPGVVRETLSLHERARNSTCDNVYVALNGFVANERDGAMNGATGNCDVRDVSGVIRCALWRHAKEKNPLDKHQRAYTDAAPAPCQVSLAPLSTNGVTFSQVPRAGASTRTFSIRVD